MTPDLGPVPSEFFLSQLSPLEYEPKGTRRKASRRHTALDVHGHQELTVTRMEVRWSVITIIHFDRNAEEPAEYGHCEWVPVAIPIFVTDPLRASSNHCS